MQPGGGDNITLGWESVAPYATKLNDWVHKGGKYVGICMGGYLAGTDPGFGLLPDANAFSYIETPNADIKNMSDFLLTWDWGKEGKPEKVYFQGHAPSIFPSIRLSRTFCLLPGGPSFTLGAAALADPKTKIKARWVMVQTII